MDHKGRQVRLQSVLANSHLDALLVTHLPNIRYLCGFTGSAGALLVCQNRTVFFTDGRYKEQARTEVQGARVNIARKPPLVAAAEWLKANGKKLGVEVLGIEDRHLTVADHSQLVNLLRPGIRIRNTPALVEQARMVKDSEEIRCLAAAAQLGSSLFDVAVKALGPGVRETDVAAELEYVARRKGAEGMSFETIVTSGARSALPHGRASTAKIPANGFVICDFGIILAGYCSDMTRTLHVGRLSSDAQRMYDAVGEAQEAAINRVSAGVRVDEVDRAARQVLGRSGLGKYFTHSTGHGVGLEIHEMPRVAAGQHEPLLAGMVITIEPGVYVPGVGGVRIEDMVLVTGDGCEVLTPTSKEIIKL
ncbi:MAG TPA: Xaa-Pro peptidase family protein [Terriglobales bacterium]|nr:Xaa-Pro peptidase family protein [Terriglobales bacterium]